MLFRRVSTGPPLTALLSFDPKAMRETKDGYIGRVDSPSCGNILHVIDVVIWKKSISIPEFDANRMEITQLT